MRAAVISYTENGRLLSLEISRNIAEIRRFCYKTHTDGQAEVFNSTKNIVEKLWHGTDALIFACACGIAVRAIAPYLKSKQTDPAVVVIDDCGKYVIPVLSGHIGGANAIAERLADILGAQAVITTATDIGGHFSPDSFAVANDLIIGDISAAKAIACAVLDGEKIGLVSDFPMKNIPAEFGDSEKIGMYIGTNSDISPFVTTLRLIPRNVVIGIGCRKGTAENVIVETVEKALLAAEIPAERICGVASIDLKSHENGLLNFCGDRGYSIKFYTSAQLSEAEGDFTASPFVKNITGVDNVCERAAVLCSGGALIMRKFAENGVTVAAAEKTVDIDFERKIL